MKRVAVSAIVLVLVLAAIGYTFIRKRGDKNGAGVKVSGNIEVTDVQVSFKISGRVKERLVDEGESVRAEQVVARLEDEDLLHDVERRRKEVLALTATLEELERGSRKEEIAQADAAVNRARAEADRLAADFARQQELYKREVISRREFEASKAAQEGSQAALREVTAQQALVREGPRRERIAFARARLQEAREEQAQAQTRLGYSTLKSPLAGLVLSKNVEPGEQVAAGTPVITVGEIDNTWLRAYIAETDLGRVKVGQKARVRSDTYPDKVYEGTVSFISPEAEFTPKNVQTEKERVKLVYRIKITIPNPRMELKPGMPADAEIIVQ